MLPVLLLWRKEPKIVACLLLLLTPPHIKSEVPQLPFLIPIVTLVIPHLRWIRLGIWTKPNLFHSFLSSALILSYLFKGLLRLGKEDDEGAFKRLSSQSGYRESNEENFKAKERTPKSPDKWWFRRDSASDYYLNGMCMSGFRLASRRVPT